MSDMVGYARATAGDLATGAGRELTEAGCARVYVDEQTSRQTGRPQLAACLESLRPEDTLVVASLDQLGRSQRELFALVDDVRRRGAGLRSLRGAAGHHRPGRGGDLPGVRRAGRFRPGDDLGRDQRRAGRRPRQREAARPASGADAGAAPRGPRAAAAARAHDFVGRAGDRRQPVHDLQVPAGGGPRPGRAPRALPGPTRSPGRWSSTTWPTCAARSPVWSSCRCGCSGACPTIGSTWTSPTCGAGTTRRSCARPPGRATSPPTWTGRRWSASGRSCTSRRGSAAAGRNTMRPCDPG